MPHRTSFRWLVPFAAGMSLYAQTLHLKRESVKPARPAEASATWIVQFPERPGTEEFRALQSSGLQILAPVSNNGFVVRKASGRMAFRPQPLPGATLTPFTADMKISPVFDQQDPAGFVVEFWPDVAIDDMRIRLSDAGFELIDHPDLISTQLLVRGTPDGVALISEWDEVSYIFPASDQLLSGEPLIGCSGASLDGGLIGMYVQRVGEGWDGAGKGSVDLGYFVQNYSSKLTNTQQLSEYQRAMAEWSKYAAIRFNPASSATASKTVTFLTGSGAHGDNYPFDGPGKVLGHTFYPAPTNSEPIAGDMHLDADENWRIGADIDLFSVVLHELGHALGLGHSDQPGAVMYPYYSRATGLTNEDTGAILQMYAAATTAQSSLALNITSPASGTATSATSVSLAGTASGSNTPLTITWVAGDGTTGTATGTTNWTAMVPLKTGANTIIVTAKDSTNATISKSISVTRQTTTAAAISILTPASGSGVDTPRVNVKGSASHPSGIKSVTWTNGAASGTAAGTTSWTADIPLLQGPNYISFSATPANSNTGTVSTANLAVTYTPPRDNTPPNITITAPTSALASSSAGSYVMKGTSSDNIGVTKVTWASSTGASGVATGTTSWTVTVPLLIGNNIIKITAMDQAGNASWRSVTITRR